MYNMDSNLVANVLSHPATIIFLMVVAIAVLQGLHKEFKNYINK
jgi:hypothetical protein